MKKKTPIEPGRPSLWRETVGRELRQAGRRIARRPVFSSSTIMTLALGVGAAAAIFTLLEAVVLAPLPYPQPHRLVRLYSTAPHLSDSPWGLAKGQHLYLRRASASFEEIGLYTLSRASLEPLSEDRQAEQVSVAQVGAGVPAVLGVRPLLGRPLVAEHNLEVHPTIVWLAHDFWNRRFGGDREIAGRNLVLDGRSLEIAGVLPAAAKLPEEHRLPELQVDLWTPLRLDPAQPAEPSHIFKAIGRLRPEATLSAAAAELRRLTARLPEALPEAYSEGFLRKTGFSTRVTPLRDEVVGTVERSVWLLFGAAVLLLLVACANVANLFVAHAEAGRQAIATRLALGADRAHLSVHFLAESLLLTGAAGAVGLLLAHGALGLVDTLAPSGLPRIDEIRLGAPTVGFVAVVTLGVGLLFGLLPATRRTGLVSPGAPGQRGDRRRGRAARSVLIVGQMALSLILLAGAGLLVWSFRNLTSVSPGFDPRDVSTFRVVLPESSYASFEAVGGYYRELAERLEALPDIESAGLAATLPLTGFGGCSALYVAGDELAPGEQAPCVPFYLVSPGYFRTLGIRVTGTSPEWRDFAGRAPAALVGEALAERLWPGEDPIGKEVRASRGSAPYRVVGVAGDVRADGLDRPPTEALYLPLVPAAAAELWPPLTDVSVVVRGRPGSAGRLLPSIRQTLAELDRRVSITAADSMEGIVARSIRRISAVALLLGTAAAMALLLSAVGIYGLVSYLTVQRRSEIGIRLALGADRGGVQRLVVAQSVRLAAAGVALGLLGAILLTRFLRSLLFEVSPTHPGALGATAVVLLILAVLASWIPARRAARVPPAESLRPQ